MKKVTVKIPAKINLTLDVVGVKDGFHDIESLVTSVDIYDKITVKKRTDKKITLTEKGILSNCLTENNNAYKSAVLFMQTFRTDGVDIILDKSIPVGAGLGGSSADIAGTLLAMKKLFGIKKDIKPLADSLGSDSGYMTVGGPAIISGRGDKVISLKEKIKLYLLIITEDFSVSAKECYKTFDGLGEKLAPTTMDGVNALHDGDYLSFVGALKNDLYLATKKLHPNLSDNLSALKGAGADAYLMTGSGSAVYGVFKKKAQRDLAYKTLYLKYKDKLIKSKTV